MEQEQTTRIDLEKEREINEVITPLDRQAFLDKKTEAVLTRILPNRFNNKALDMVLLIGGQEFQTKLSAKNEKWLHQVYGKTPIKWLNQKVRFTTHYVENVIKGEKKAGYELTFY